MTPQISKKPDMAILFSVIKSSAHYGLRGPPVLAEGPHLHLFSRAGTLREKDRKLNMGKRVIIKKLGYEGDGIIIQYSTVGDW